MFWKWQDSTFRNTVAPEPADLLPKGMTLEQAIVDC
jgi:hypothetical protein